MRTPPHGGGSPKRASDLMARVTEALLLLALLCWTGLLAARLLHGGLPGTVRSTGPSGATGGMMFSDRAEAAVEIRGRGLVLWWKESPVPLSQEQAREIAGFILAPGAAATLVAGEWSFHAADSPVGTGAFRLARRIGDAVKIEYTISGADAAEIARLLSAAGGGG